MTRAPQSNRSSPGSFNQRIFAWMTAHSGDQYEDEIRSRKQALFGNLHGAVLEIGPGAGPNIHYYPEGIQWLGVEPNPFMVPYLEKVIRKLGPPPGSFRIDPGDPKGNRLPAGDASMEAVVSTLVLCSVPDPEATVREIRRVLKPGGRFVFIEHVAAPRGSLMREVQNFIQPLWTLAAAGCHPNRETWETIAHAGFAQVKLEHFSVPGAGLVGPQIAGSALKDA